MIVEKQLKVKSFGNQLEKSAPKMLLLPLRGLFFVSLVLLLKYTESHVYKEIKSQVS